jgi:hypothetical protein
VSSLAVRRSRPALAALAAVAGVLVTVAGCSSSSSSSSAGSSPSAGASTAPASPGPTTAPTGALALPTASMTPLPAATGQLTGTQLEAVLLPQSEFPAGFTTPSSGAVSSGASLTTTVATYNLKTVPCATFIEHLGTTGFGETAMTAGSVGAAAQGYDQLLYQFVGGVEASSFTSGIQALAGRCGSFKVSANGSTGTFSLHAAAGPAVAGHPSVELTETGSLGTNKVSLDLLLCTSGVDVFGAGAAGANGTAAPTTVTREAIIYQLMKRQAAAATLG